MSIEFDTIIVGAGSAGCLLANRLSANPNHKVLLIEAGGKDDWIWIKIPVGYLYTIANPRTDWCFKKFLIKLNKFKWRALKDSNLRPSV